MESRLASYTIVGLSLSKGPLRETEGSGRGHGRRQGRVGHRQGCGFGGGPSILCSHLKITSKISNISRQIISSTLWAWRGPLVKRMWRITKTQLGVPEIAADDPWKSQPWPAVFTFPIRVWGWLEQIPFVQILSTHPTGVAILSRALR